MTRMLTAAVMALCLSYAAEAQEEHGRYDFPYVLDGQEYFLTYEGTHDVAHNNDPAVKLVILVHHGGSQNPVTYFDRMVAALNAANEERPELDLAATTMVISPGMIGEHHIADNPGRYDGGHYPYWDGGWREGANSVNDPQVSNYDLLDGLLLHIVRRFPNVKAVVQAGHSAGGQLVNRYSVGTTVYDSLRARGIFVRYIVANPSSVLYFDRQRPDLLTGEGFVEYRDASPVVAGVECREFNEYKYGLDNRDPYMTRRPVAAMLNGFRERPVYLFQGLDDDDPSGDGVDRDCPALLQGRHRLERGRRYYEYLGHYYGPDVYQTKFIEFAPGVGHHSGEMFQSEPGKSIIFVNADSAAASLEHEDAVQRHPEGFIKPLE